MKPRDVLFSVFVMYALCGIFAGHLYFIDMSGPILVSGALWKILFVVSVLWISLGVRSPSLRPNFVFTSLPFGLLLLLLGDYLIRRWTFFSTPDFRWYVVGGGVVSTALVYLFRARGAQFIRLSPFFLLAIQCVLLAGFTKFASGRMIFSDDHPSFLYRLQLLTEMFPRIPFYNPDWNAGWSAREFFATGSLPFLFFVSPIAYSVDLLRVENLGWYTVCVGLIGTFLLPLSVYLGGHFFRRPREECAIAALLSIAPSLGLCEWLLHYGTVGFVISSALSVPLVALGTSLFFESEKCSIARVGLLAVLCTLCFFWPLGVAIVAPLGVLALGYRCTRVRAVSMGLLVAMYVVLNSWWIPTFVREARVLEFLSSSKLPGTHAELEQKSESKPSIAPWKRASKLLDQFRELASKVNPILFFLGLPALLWLKGESERNVLLMTVLWLLILAAFGDLIKPQLELRRMILPATFFLCIPSAAYIAEVIRRAGTNDGRLVRKMQKAGALVLVLGFCFVTPLNARGYYQNKSDMRFVFAPPELPQLVQSLRTLGPGGRIFFFGFVLHELGASNSQSQDGGHIAPLASLSGRMMYASHFYHARWSAVDPIPSDVRKNGPEAIERFLDLLQVTGVVASRSDWLSYIQTRPGYREVTTIGRYHLFERTMRSRMDWIDSGEGEVRVISHDAIEIVPRSETLVLRFRHEPLLRANVRSGVTITPEFAFDEEVGGGKTVPFNLVRLTVDPSIVAAGSAITIGYNQSSRE